MKFYAIVALVFITLLRPGSVQAQFILSCGNDGQRVTQDSQAEVGDPINPYQGNLTRQITDISTFGAAPIRFTRSYCSRTLNFNTPYWDFGSSDTWQHNWNYEMRQLTTKTFGFFDIKVRYPDGREYNFAAADATGNQLVPTADCGDRLYRWSGSTVGYTMVTPTGWEYHFQRIGSPKFQMLEVHDGQGAVWTISHDGDAKITRIENAYGRFIEFGRTMINGVSCLTSITTDDGREVDYNYTVWTPTGQPVLTSVTYPGSEQALYTWVGSDSPTTGRALLATASDPTDPSFGATLKFSYNYNAIFDYGSGPYLVTGTVLSQQNLTTSETVIALPLGSGPDAQIIQGSGAQIKRTFTNGQLSALQDAQGRLTQYTRTASGFGYIASKTASNGGITSYGRDYAGRILSLTNPVGGVSQNTYNSAGFLVSYTDELSHATSITRDSGNLPLRIDYPDGSYETNTYNATGQVLTHRARNGGVSTYVYYGSGETGGLPGDLKSSTDALGGVTVFTYGNAGLPVSVRDPLGHATTFTYNWRGQPLTVIYADGSSVSYQYDNFGNRIQVTDELGHSTLYAYNEYQHVISVTDALGRTIHYEYGLAPGSTTTGYASTIARVIYPSGKKIERTYDNSAKIISETVAPGTGSAATRSWTYNTAGDVASVTDALGHATTFGYDLKHRLLSSTDPLGHATSQTYDATGNVRTITRADAGVTTNTFDSMSRMLNSTDPKGQVTQYAYDAGGRLVSLTDAKSQAHGFAYDLLDRRTRLTYPGGSHEDWAFDAAGNLTSYTTRAGQVRLTGYDLRNREITSDWSDATPDTKRTYDAAGRLLTLATGTLSSGALTATQTSLAYAYDNANQLSSETYMLSPLAPALTAKSIAYSYDADGNLAELVYPDGTSVAYDYTARGQLADIALNGAAPLASYAYDLAGRRTGLGLENGTTAIYTYDNASRLLEIDHYAGTTALAAFAYSYNAVNNRTAMASAQPGLAPAADSYVYDAVDQLTGVGYGSGRTVGYAYDAVGNRSGVTDTVSGASTYTANTLNQYTAVIDGSGTRSPTYDGNGNLIAQGSWTYTYDAQNRLTSAAGATQRLDTVYDACNRAVFRAAYTRAGPGAGWALADSYAQVYDGWKLIAEYTPADTVQARYVYGPGADELLVRTDAGGSVYYHRDALGSARVLTGATGAALETYTYDAFGQASVFDPSGTALTGTAYGNRFLFTGREWLAGIQLYDYRNRMYSQEFGRFLQSDPLRFGAKDINLYRYAGNSPIILVDPSGLVIWKDFIGSALSLGANTVTMVGGGLLAETGVGAVAAVYGAYGAGASIGNMINAWNDKPQGPSGPAQAVLNVVARDSSAANTTGKVLDLAVPLVTGNIGGFGKFAVVTEDAAKAATVTQALTTGAVNADKLAPVLSVAQYADAGVQLIDSYETVNKSMESPEQENKNLESFEEEDEGEDGRTYSECPK